jgi:transcriptional regulator with XRE-family HTH domain
VSLTIERLKADIGAAVKRSREERGISSGELGRLAGVSKATIANLERGAGNPTLETLTAVAAVLSVSLSDFVGQGGVRSAIELTRVEDTVEVAGEAVHVRFLRRFFSGGALIELYTMTMAASAQQVSPAHARGLREHIVLFSGSLRAGPMGEEVEAGPGEMLSFDADREHAYESDADPVEATLLMEYPVDQARVMMAAGVDRPS